MGGTQESKELVPAKAPAARKAVADRLAEKRNTGAALLALVQFKKISQAEAWRRLHPLATNVTDTQARFRARRLLQWYLTYYPPNFQQALELNHLGRQPHPAGAAGRAEGHQVGQEPEAGGPGLDHPDACSTRPVAAERHHAAGRLPRRGRSRTPGRRAARSTPAPSSRAPRSGTRWR